MKKILSILFATLFFLGCSSKNHEERTPIVVTSTYALYDVASFIAGEYIDVRLLLQPGMEVHSFEPTPKDVALLHKSKLFLYNGAGLEPWVERFAKGINSIDMSGFVTLQKALHHHHHHSSSHNGFDPHYWLDITNQQKISKIIAQKLAQLDPKHKDVFMQNAQRYMEKLEALDQEYHQGLQSCKKDTIFVNHNAYSYLARRYGFKVDSLVGLSPDAKPSPKAIEEILKEIKDEKIKVIFGESFENNNVVKMIAKDSGVSFEILHPLANLTKEEAKQHQNYFSIMRQNLQKLHQAMECK